MKVYINAVLFDSLALSLEEDEHTRYYLDMENNLKEIVTAAEAVKKKFKKMRNVESEYERAIGNVFKPVLSPLNKITDAMRQTESKETTCPIKNGETKFENEIDDSIDRSAADDTLRNIRRSDQFMTPTHSLDRAAEMEGEDSDNDFNEGQESDISQNSIESDANTQNQNCSSWSLTSEYLKNTPFGVRVERGKLLMGSANVNITDKTITIGTSDYNKTRGLMELLTKKLPDLADITKEDLANYKLMLLETNAHRRDYDSNKPVKSNKGIKYLNIIKPLFNKHDNSESNQVQGSGLPVLKKWKKNIDYVYWDDPNELVDRLKLLIASRDAGNTGLDNEIISIIEELKESGLLG